MEHDGVLMVITTTDTHYNARLPTRSERWRYRCSAPFKAAYAWLVLLVLPRGPVRDLLREARRRGK